MALRIGIIGLGDVSMVHLHAIKSNKNAKLVAVCDIDENKKDLVKDAKFYTDYNEMIKNENLDCVHICLPHYLHYPVTKEVANLGVNILLEKPLCLNAEEANKFKKLHDNTDSNICICLQNRYNKTTKHLLNIVNSKEYGKVIGIKGIVTWSRPKEYYDIKPWRGSMKLAGGGVMINQSIHTLDLMQLLGGKIDSIKGQVSNLLDYDIEVEDTASASINFSNGAKGLFFSTIAYCDSSSVEIQVILEKGKFTIKDSKLYKSVGGEKVLIVEDDKLSGSKHYYGASHKEIINDYYNCLINNTKDYITINDAIPSIKIIDSIRTSSKDNKQILWG